MLTRPWRRRASTPVAANRLRKLLQAMMKLAILQGWRKDNPCLAVENFKIKSKGHRTWTDEEIDAYRQHYAIGTEQRLAFELLLNTGQRVSDVVKDGPQAPQGRLHHHHPKEERRDGRGHRPDLARAQGGAR